jgi:hypothetical protein
MNLSVCAEGERPAPARSVDAAIAYRASYSRKSQSPNHIFGILTYEVLSLNVERCFIGEA